MKNTSSNLPVVATINFHGTELITIKKDDHEFVAMRPVVEGIGLDWKTQRIKLSPVGEDMPSTQKTNRGHMPPVNKFNCTLIGTVAADGKNREMLCMPITKLNGWLFTINPNKIPNLDVRKRVIEYQEECFIALYDYWHKGKAERMIPDTITPAEQHDISEAVRFKAEGNGKATQEIWSRFKNKFKVAKYSQLSRDRFEEAINYILNMELKSIQPPPPVQVDLEKMRLQARIDTLEEVNEFLRDSNMNYIKLYREMVNIAVELAKSRLAPIRI